MILSRGAHAFENQPLIADKPTRKSSLSLTFLPGSLPEPLLAIRNAVAVEFVRKMGGKSSTSLVRADDGQCYVAKLPGPQHEVRKLGNEMLATRLAAILGLPVRPGAVVTIPHHLIPEDGEPRLGGVANSIPRSTIACFGSSYPGTPGENLVVDFLPQKLLRHVSNFRDAFWGFLVFDLWTGRTSPRQAIFSRSATSHGAPYSAWMISHGSCFGWTGLPFAADLPLAYYMERSVYSHVAGMESFEPYLSRIEAIQPRQIEECGQAIPADWLAGEAGKLRHLMTVLYERRTLVRQALMAAIEGDRRTFPNLS
jgi:hypothetical protein